MPAAKRTDALGGERRIRLVRPRDVRDPLPEGDGPGVPGDSDLGRLDAAACVQGLREAADAGG